MKRTIIEMLTENTGRHMLDSGGAYGRHWQNNQNVDDWDKTPVITWDVWPPDEINISVSVYHYLTSGILEIDDICKKFNDINVNSDNWDSEIYGVSKEAEVYLNSLDATPGHPWNTYNGECTLSQTLQGCYVDIDGEKYCILQIHGGCDVRGGYTDARLFKFTRDDEGHIIPCPDVYGTVDGVDVSTLYHGYCLSIDDPNGAISGDCPTVTENSKIELYLMEN
jgi:hypothetical protein